MPDLPPVPWEDPSLDPARLRVEIQRAVETETLVEQVTPGLLAALDGDEVVIFERAAPDDDRTLEVELGRFPLWRIRRWDPDRMHRVAAAALEQVPPEVADHLAAAINARRWATDEPPGSDWVGLIVDGYRLAAVHRSCLVPGWPPDEP